MASPFTDQLPDTLDNTIDVQSIAAEVAASVTTQLLALSAAGIQRVYWSEDGQKVVYGTWQEHSGLNSGWWEYAIHTGEQYDMPSPFHLTASLWSTLGLDENEQARYWSSVRLLPSPNGKYVMYSRVSAEYKLTPGESYFPVYEAVIAHTDGSGVVKVHDNCNVVETIWFDQAQHVIFTCATEGGWSEILMTDVEGEDVRSLSHVFGGWGTTGMMVLSSDETVLAFTDDQLKLRIAALDGSLNYQVQTPCEGHHSPNWSANGRQVYFLCEEQNVTAIYVYDLDTRTHTRFITSPILTADGREVELHAGDPCFLVSPRENAAVFCSSGLWLLTWSP